MMQAYRTEGNYRSAARLSPAELRAAMANREILQATALAFDTQRQLRFEIGGVRAVMPFAQCADGAANGTVRDIAVLTRVGHPTCFVIEALDTDENGQPFYRLSRALAQQMCKADYLDALQPGDILLHGHTHVPAWEPFSLSPACTAPASNCPSPAASECLYLNPGSVSIPKENSPRGYMILTDHAAEWKTLEGEGYHRYSFISPRPAPQSES